MLERISIAALASCLQCYLVRHLRESREKNQTENLLFQRPQARTKCPACVPVLTGVVGIGYTHLCSQENIRV